MLPPTTDTPEKGEEVNQEPGTQELERATRSIILKPEIASDINEGFIDFQFYNCFNYSLLSADGKSVNLTLGITSANPGEGKTLVACNLAVSLAMGYGKETVLVDLNLEEPRIHDIFGTPKGPGLVDALQRGPIQISRTAIEHLSILTAGETNGHFKPSKGGKSVEFRNRGGTAPTVGLNHLADFGSIILSLEQQYDFVIVDMPSIESKGVPILYANHLDGLLVVVDSRKTRRADLERLFRRVHKKQVVGFVFNCFESDDH
ncbi:MAG TPA: CpsD/CapB family tyrosine-protein kinase [Bacteroidota bacterium]|nr:CpsD/CapB family tyrosine-protein kinase [Bacteroidota bacterium]